jgi:hypothetical protein
VIGVARMNKRMAALELPFGESSPHKLDAALAAILDEGFRETEGCIVLRRCADANPHISVAPSWDETGYEALLNHIHLEDVVAGGPPKPDLRLQVALFAERLASDLKHAYPDETFDVVIGVGDSWTVRFHKVREGQTWLTDGLEGYTLEAVMTVRVGPEAVG